MQTKSSKKEEKKQGLRGQKPNEGPLERPRPGSKTFPTRGKKLHRKRKGRKKKMHAPDDEDTKSELILQGKSYPSQGRGGEEVTAHWGTLLLLNRDHPRKRTEKDWERILHLIRGGGKKGGQPCRGPTRFCCNRRSPLRRGGRTNEEEGEPLWRNVVEFHGPPLLPQRT